MAALPFRKARSTNMVLKQRLWWMFILILPAAVCAAQPARQQKSDTAYLSVVSDRAGFDRLARVTDFPYPLPHILFIIDRAHNNRIYYVNSKQYQYHKDFVNAQYLSLERGQQFFENNYLNPDRRFVMGTLSYQTPIRRWTYEFWEGDTITAPLIQLAGDTIAKTFFTPASFKPNSLAQEQNSGSLEHIARVMPGDIAANPDYQPLSLGTAVGRLRVVDSWTDDTDVRPGDIVVASTAPVMLPPVAGIITTHPSTPLSHINLRARAMGIPNAFIKNADTLLRKYDGKIVTLKTTRDQYLIGAATAAQVAKLHTDEAKRKELLTPHADLTVTKLADLADQPATSVTAYGAKSANLGEVMRAHLPGIVVPGGFTIPFHYYKAFLTANKLDEKIAVLDHEPNWSQDAALRRKRLAELRKTIQDGNFDPALRTEILNKAHTGFAGKGLFIRSSTNSEDLPNFNGAGLYTTVPNMRTDDQIINAIKTVWASIWNDEAYEARAHAGIDHAKVYMAVLIQEGINSESAGVMITTDPYNVDDHQAVYITAKRGLGIKVVEGAKIAEQMLFHPKTNAIQVLTRSGEDSLLQFDPNGGVREVAITGPNVVLTDLLVRQLSSAAGAIKHVFHDREQDIEWASMGGQVYIVQARPFIDAGA